MSRPVFTPRRAPRRRRPRNLLPAVLAAAALAAIAVAVLALSGGDSGEGGGAAADGDRLERLAAGLVDDLAEPWPDVQRDNGHYRSAVGGGTRYGDALLGYAMLQAGLRTGNERWIDSAFAGFRFSLHRPQQPNRPSAFENLSLAAAYNVARRDFARDPRFERLRPQWERFLRRVRVDRLVATTYYGNHWLAEAVMVQELLRSGLRSDDPFAALGGYRAEARRLSEDLVNERIPGMARERGTRAGGEPAFILSDPPEDPLAYQGLSLGMYARAIELLGDRAAPAARRTLRQVANASTWLAGPDGDLAYAGRNQEQVWALAATAYGASVAAAGRGSDRAEDGRYRALAERSLERIRDVHGIGRFGVHVTPAIAQGRVSGGRGVDPGAGGPSFGGLAQMFVELSLPTLERLRDAPIGELPSDSDGRAILGEGEGSLAVVRSGRVWFAVRRSPSGKSPHDIRYDFGLVALKVRKGDGSWTDALRLRPIRSGGPDSAGPILRSAPGGAGIPYGERLGVARDGTVTVTAGFRGPPSVQKLIAATTPWGTIVRGQRASPGVLHRGGVRFTFRPVDCGVEMRFPTRAGDRVEQSVFFTQQPRVGPTELEDPATRVTLTEAARTRVEPGYASGADKRLFRARSAYASGGGPAGMRICAPD